MGLAEAGFRTANINSSSVDYQTFPNTFAHSCSSGESDVFSEVRDFRHPVWGRCECRFGYSGISFQSYKSVINRSINRIIPSGKNLQRKRIFFSQNVAATCMKMTGVGMRTTQWRDRIGWGYSFSPSGWSNNNYVKIWFLITIEHENMMGTFLEG